MRNPDPKIAHLCELLSRLPGTGPRSAARIVEALTGSRRELGREIAESLADVLEHAHRCPCCHVMTTLPVCAVCSDPERDSRLLCIVESQADEQAIEATMAYRGRYFVLGGRLDPLAGTRPEDLGMDLLVERVQKDGVREAVVATSYTPDGEITAQMVIRLLRSRCPKLRVTRLARGLPAGVEVEYTDPATLSAAMIDRRES